MMNDQDRDLILGIAGGSLSTTETEAAIARISADSELTDELAAQISAIGALATAGDVTLTADERTALRASLIAQLHLADAPTPTAPKRRTPWWQPVFGIAAVAAVFVFAILLLPDTTGDDAADLEALPALSDAQDRATDFNEGAPQATAESAETTMAPEDEQVVETNASDGSEGLVEIPVDAQDLGGAAILEATKGDTTSDEIHNDLRVSGMSTMSTDVASTADECLSRIDGELPDGQTYRLDAETAVDGIFYIAVDSGTGIDAVVSVDLETCTIVDIDS